MNCLQITQAEEVLRIVQNPHDGRLQQLFSCIYRLFRESFVAWICGRFAANADKDRLREDAKDAFQNGLMAFYNKAQGNKEFTLGKSLKTVLYSYGWLQLMAFFKKQKGGHYRNAYLQGLQVLLEDETLEAERRQMLNEKETALLKAVGSLPPRTREILLLKFVEKLKSKEIGARLNLAPGSVDNEVSKGLKELRRMLGAKSPKNKTHENDG